MIVDNIKNLYKYLPEKIVKTIIEEINKLHSDIEDVKINILGEDVYLKVMSYTTKERELCKPESHKKYIDIQSIISGTEGIDFFIPKLEQVKVYDTQQDVAFYNYDKEHIYAHVDVYPGSFAMIYPEEIHMPQIIVKGQKDNIKKYVVKVNIDLLK